MTTFGMNRISRCASRMCSRPLRARRVLVAVLPAHPLVAAGAERPAAVLRARAVAGEDHAADVGGQPGVLERGDQLVDRLRPERVAHLGPVEGDADDAGVDRPVIGDVGEVEALDRLPGGAVEDLGDVVAGAHGCEPNAAASARSSPGPPVQRAAPVTAAQQRVGDRAADASSADGLAQARGRARAAAGCAAPACARAGCVVGAAAAAAGCRRRRRRPLVVPPVRAGRRPTVPPLPLRCRRPSRAAVRAPVPPPPAILRRRPRERRSGRRTSRRPAGRAPTAPGARRARRSGGSAGRPPARRSGRRRRVRTAAPARPVPPSIAAAAPVKTPPGRCDRTCLRAAGRRGRAPAARRSAGRRRPGPARGGRGDRLPRAAGMAGRRRRRGRRADAVPGRGAWDGGTGPAPSVVASSAAAVTAYPRSATSCRDAPDYFGRRRSSGRSRASDDGQPGVQRHRVQPVERQPRRAVALAVQPQVRGLDRAGPAGPGRSCRTSRRGRRPSSAPRTTSSGSRPSSSRTSRSAPASGGSPSCSAPPGRAPGAAVVRPVGAVLQQHLGPVLAVAVQEQAGRAGPAPVAVAQGAGGPAVGGGEHGPVNPVARNPSGPGCTRADALGWLDVRIAVFTGSHDGPPSHRAAAAAFATDLAKAGVGHRLRRRQGRPDGRRRRRRAGRRRRGRRRHPAAPGRRRGGAPRAAAAGGRRLDARAQGGDGRPRRRVRRAARAPRARSRSCSRPGPGACSACTPSRRR